MFIIGSYLILMEILHTMIKEMSMFILQDKILICTIKILDFIAFSHKKPLLCKMLTLTN